MKSADALRRLVSANCHLYSQLGNDINEMSSFCPWFSPRGNRNPLDSHVIVKLRVI